jgi:hypothetical protein
MCKSKDTYTNYYQLAADKGKATREFSIWNIIAWRIGMFQSKDTGTNYHQLDKGTATREFSNWNIKA